MILDAFGPEAGPLLAAGALGGLVRGLVVFRSVIAKAAITGQVLVNTGVDTGTTVVIGAIISLFFHGLGEELFDLPVLNGVSLEGTARTLTSGFVVGFGCIAVAGILWDWGSGLTKKPAAAPVPPAPINQPGVP